MSNTKRKSNAVVPIDLYRSYNGTDGLIKAQPNDVEQENRETGIQYYWRPAIDAIRETKAQQSSSKEARGDGAMDDATKMMIERLERDSREREDRYHADAREREERYRADLKEREERIIKHFDDKFDSQQRLLEEKLSNLNSNMNDIKTEMTTVTSRVDSVHGRVDGVKSFIIGSSIAIILGVIGIVYANWQVISAMLQMSGNK